MEYSVGDFDSLEEAENYFVATYMQEQALLSNILFLLDEDKSVVGSCIAWQDKRKDSYVSSLHWLIVDKKYHGMGLGKALCCATMNIFEEHKNFPVYIHTQPWSWKTIFLYLSLGFKHPYDHFCRNFPFYDPPRTGRSHAYPHSLHSLFKHSVC